MQTERSLARGCFLHVRRRSPERQERFGDLERRENGGEQEILRRRFCNYQRLGRLEEIRRTDKMMSAIFELTELKSEKLSYGEKL